MTLIDVLDICAFPVWICNDDWLEDDRYEEYEACVAEQSASLYRKVNYISVDGAGELVIGVISEE